MNFASILVACICVVFHCSQGELVDCPAEGIVYLAHSKYNHFNICLDGEAAEMMCPFSLYYNPETSQCDFPENVSGCRGGTRPPISSSTTSTEEPSTTTESPPGEMTKCGQTTIADNGTIEYKLHENYEVGELCIFTIKFESGERNSTFTLDTHGFGDLDTDAAVTILNRRPALRFEANLRVHQQNVNVIGLGAFVIFRTNSSSGTGFRLSFKGNPIDNARLYSGIHAVFDNETDSPLKIPYPFNYSNEIIYNHFIFMSGSKIISDPDAHFKLTAKTVFGNVGCHACYN